MKLKVLLRSYVSRFICQEKELLSISGCMDFNPIACTKIAPIIESLWLKYFHTLCVESKKLVYVMCTCLVFGHLWWRMIVS